MRLSVDSAPVAVIPDEVDSQQNNSGHDGDDISSIHRKASFFSHARPRQGPAGWFGGMIALPDGR